MEKENTHLCHLCIACSVGEKEVSPHEKGNSLLEFGLSQFQRDFSSHTLSRKGPKMVVWTIQPESLWLQLQRDGVLYGPRASEANFQEFRAAYDWIASQMGKRLGPSPRADRYPLWAWYQWGNAKQRRPDLRSVGHVGRGKRGVRIEFDIDEQDILLSGFDEWHVVLNGGYLAVNEEDACAFDAAFASACKECGRAKAVSQFRKPIVSSWERIFDLDMDRFSQENYWADRADKPIQGTFWVLHLEQVRTVTFFTGR